MHVQGLMSGPFRVEGGKTTGAVVSGSGNRQQFLDLFEQIFRYVEQHHTRAGIPLAKPPPSPAGAAEAAEAAGGGGGGDDRWVGARVRLVGLVSRGDLNGAAGLVVKFDSKKGRYAVQLDGTDASSKPVAVKPDNLQMLDDADGGGEAGADDSDGRDEL
jgi:hypothetical protein